MSHPIRYAAWQHILLAGYVWVIAAIPLGDWNRQPGERLLPSLLHGQAPGVGDLASLLFISLPAVLCWVAYRRRSVWIAGLVVTFDAVWLSMQVLTWWVPYILGKPHEWQIRYARGPTTKVLPSVGSHLAPDGMHFVIHVLLACAMVTAAFGMRQLMVRRPPPDGPGI